MSADVKEWRPITKNPQPSSNSKPSSSIQLKPAQSQSSLKDIQNQQGNGQPSSQLKNVAFKNDSTASLPNQSIRLKQRSGIFYDISAGRGNFDDGCHTDYAHSLKQSYSAGNLSFKSHSNNQFPSSSSVSSFSHAESGYGQNQKKQKSNQRSNNNNNNNNNSNNRINRSGSFTPRGNDKYKPPVGGNSNNKSNNGNNSNNNYNNRNSNNNRNFNSRNNHNQDGDRNPNPYNYQPKQQPTNNS